LGPQGRAGMRSMGTGADNAAASENGEEEEKALRPSERNGEEEALGTWARATHTETAKSFQRSPYWTVCCWAKN
jgi:hypothetical protein